MLKVVFTRFQKIHIDPKMLLFPCFTIELIGIRLPTWTTVLLKAVPASRSCVSYGKLNVNGLYFEL